MIDVLGLTFIKKYITNILIMDVLSVAEDRIKKEAISDKD